MRWQGGRTGGGGIEDRRGLGGGAIAGGGLGVGVLAIIGYLVFGIDPSTTTQLASQFGGVDILINNVSQHQQSVPSGPFELQQFPTVTGSGEMQLQVTDLLG